MSNKITHGIIVMAVMASLCPEKTQAQANTSLSNLVAPTSVNTHLLPDTDGTRDLGSGSKGWRSLYLTNSLYIRAQRFLSGDVDYNTSVGFNSGISLSGGAENVSIGYNALANNVSGNNNVAIGAYSLYSSHSESSIAIGHSALYANTTGYENIAIGRSAVSSNLSGTGITGIGHYSLTYNKADNVTAVGYYALYSNVNGLYNTAVGASALIGNTNSSNNTAIGHNALNVTGPGEENTAVGSTTLSAGTGSGNTAVGFSVLTGNSSTDVTAVGRWAGYSSWTGGGNSFFGSYATVGETDSYNATALGFEAYATASDQVRLGNTTVISIGGYAGWTNLSDGRFKKDLRENVPGLDFINKLRPVTYTLDMDGLEAALRPAASVNAPQRKRSAQQITSRAKKGQIIYTGFVAQEEEKAAQELGFDFSGVDAPKNSKDLYGLRYAEFVVPLVKAVQQLNAENKSLEDRIKRLEELVSAKELKNSSLQLSGARLEQNAPNPFNGNTIIGYTIPDADGLGKIVVTDIKGTLIKAINVNGRGQLTLNKGSLAAGEYTYSLWLGDKLIDTKRMSIK